MKSSLCAWLLAMVVVLCLAENRAWGFFAKPEPAPGAFEAATPEATGENYDASAYDAPGYAVAPKKGIYEFPDQKSPGQDYVGQSKNMDTRLKKHEQDGRLEPGTETRTGVDGGKTAREVAEHKRIREKTGGVPAKDSDKVSNKKDPIGPNRQGLLEE